LEEYVCLTICGQSGENEDDFHKRLIEFWTFMLRNYPDDYEKVYAETTQFSRKKGLIAREYMIEVDAVEKIASLFAARGFTVEPYDLDDLYSKYEATSPDWFQIPHD
jgi:hypothetical protein